MNDTKPIMNKQLDVGELIKQKLKEQDRSIAWLAKKIPCDRANLHKMLQQHFIHSYIVYRTSQILKYDFFNLYSAYLQDDIRDRS